MITLLGLAFGAVHLHSSTGFRQQNDLNWSWYLCLKQWVLIHNTSLQNKYTSLKGTTSILWILELYKHGHFFENSYLLWKELWILPFRWGHFWNKLEEKSLEGKRKGICQHTCAPLPFKNSYLLATIISVKLGYPLTKLHKNESLLSQKKMLSY